MVEVGSAPHQVLVIEQMHHAGRPVSHGHQVWRRAVQAQQAQGRALLHAVHGVPERHSGMPHSPKGSRPRGRSHAGRSRQQPPAHATVPAEGLTAAAMRGGVCARPSGGSPRQAGGAMQSFPRDLVPQHSTLQTLGSGQDPKFSGAMLEKGRGAGVRFLSLAG